MLLHNQRGAAISWDGDVEYKWEPYGACDVPDELVPLIRATGFPVDVAPVAPREKARRAVEAASESEQTTALEAAKAALASAVDATGEAKAAAAAADARATEARKDADQFKERVRVLEEEARTLRGSATDLETLVSEKSREIGKLKQELALALTQAQPPKPATTAAKPKDK